MYDKNKREKIIPNELKEIKPFIPSMKLNPFANAKRNIIKNT